jgi:hypothetical protein
MILRDEIIDAVRKEIIGPCSEDSLDEQHEIIREAPLMKYISGILEPYQENIPDDEVIDSQDESEEEEDASDENGFVTATGTSQSSFGFSFFIDSKARGGIEITVSYGTYSKREEGGYIRRPHQDKLSIRPAEIKLRTPIKFVLQENKLAVMIIERNVANRFFDSTDNRLITISLVSLIRKEGSRRPNYEDCFYQVELTVKTLSSEPIISVPDYSIFKSEDNLNNQLLYRNIHAYGIGHGCSVIWDSGKMPITQLRSTFMPTYELFPLNHRDLKNIDLSMLLFTNTDNRSKVKNVFSQLIDQYQSWIQKAEDSISLISNVELKRRANDNISNCRKLMRRLLVGVDLLDDDLVWKAFNLMNKAMLFQQIRHSIEDRQWTINNDTLSVSEISLPKIEDPTTWPDYDPKLTSNIRLGKWRPFQIAFVLMNLISIVDPNSDEREIVDLIWFPTGGGKTEAYLGLTAFTILYNRLSGRKISGTDILMRYTLRLLTTEQFQRAASLICACELLRNDPQNHLGKSPITIGLWVGGEVTPNSKAVERFNELIQTDENYNFVLLKCPCCGKRMGKIPIGDGNTKLKGLRLHNDKVEFTCYGDCEFSDLKLPIEVVDEYIYQNPPTLVVSTVDKFALLPWEPRSRKLLGIDVPTVGKSSPLTLIIQDELHLISGPLGSLVGLYETLIEYLISSSDGTKPKIIASTATIALAKEQINALYNKSVDQICVFPTPCIDYDDNFFAFQDKSQIGRKYVGVFANSSPSFKTTQVRLMSILLQAPYLFKDTHASQIDPYYSLITYFNTIKDLGYAVTFCDDDIPKRLRELYHQYDLSDKLKRRYLNRYEELTSRKENSQIPEIRQKLSYSYPSKQALDVCLATNMISVGIDIPRLSLMCMISQPKSTSEYIQASSRVGREKSKPGVIFITYNCRRSRDRSYFERFTSYHSRIYSFVEASGVTPFSLQSVERGLPGIIIGMIRLKENSAKDVNRVSIPANEILNNIKNFILDRCYNIDPTEVDNLSNYFDYLIGKWRKVNPLFYGEYFPDTNGPQPLMIPYSFEGKTHWTIEPWKVLTSLRSIDKETELKQIKQQ